MQSNYVFLFINFDINPSSCGDAELFSNGRGNDHPPSRCYIDFHQGSPPLIEMNMNVNSDRLAPMNENELAR